MPIITSLWTQKAREFCEHYTWLYSCPQEYVSASMVVAVATALGKRTRLEWAGYTNRPNLFLALVGTSGSNKSAPLLKCLEPLFMIDKALVEQYQYNSEQVARINAERKKNNRKLAPEEQEELLPKPREQAILLSDVTPEKRNDTLAAIDGTSLALLIYFDELPALFKQFGRYNSNSEIQDLLTMFDGRYFKVSRKLSPTLVISESTTSIIGGIQDDVLTDTFASHEMIKNGFDARWLFAWPEPTDIPPIEDKQENTELRNWWNDHIINGIYHNETVPTTVTLTKEANDYYRSWVDYRSEQQNELRVQGTDTASYIMSVHAKQKILCLRYALACHFLTDRASEPTINADEMTMASITMDYFLNTSIKVYNKIQPTQPFSDIQGKQKIYQEWLEAKKDGCSVRAFVNLKHMSSKTFYEIIREFE